VLISLLFIIGIRISKLLPLKTFQVNTLFSESWISVNRYKCGHANHKVFLTPQGSKIMKERKKYF
jgi:hypothetical protein